MSFRFRDNKGAFVPFRASHIYCALNGDRTMCGMIPHYDVDVSTYMKLPMKYQCAFCWWVITGTDDGKRPVPF